jgi:hypothetical protein
MNESINNKFRFLIALESLKVRENTDEIYIKIASKS